MANKSVPLSARISADDAEFLAALEVDGATTPSDKLRAIVGDARRRHGAARDYPGALRFAEDTVSPALRQVRAAEVDEDMHSELVARVAEWLPETLAYFLASSGGGGRSDADNLRKLEAGLAKRVTTLMQSTLQLGLSQPGAAYDGDILNERLTCVLDLAEVVRKNRGRR